MAIITRSVSGDIVVAEWWKLLSAALITYLGTIYIFLNSFYTYCIPFIVLELEQLAALSRGSNHMWYLSWHSKYCDINVTNLNFLFCLLVDDTLVMTGSEVSPSQGECSHMYPQGK